MRRFYMWWVFILCSSLSWGVPFGVAEEALEEDTVPGQLWTQILSARPITLKLVLPASLEPRRAPLEEQVQRAFNMWFSDTAAYIEKAGRAAEFADVLPILRRGLVFGPGGVEDQVEIYDSVKELRAVCKYDLAVGCASVQRKLIRILTQEELDRELDYRKVPREPVWVTLAHEFGHQLGFIGQYPMETMMQIDEVAPDSHSSESYVQETVMSASRHHGKIGCDDTDAIINMIDLQRGGARGARAGKMWKSFCKQSKDQFRDGKCVNCSSYRIREVGTEWGYWIVDIGDGFKNYDLYSMSIPPQKMADIKETILERDKENRATKTQTNQGETVYYEYFQAVTRKAAFFRGELAWVESIYKHHVNDEYVHKLEFWAYQPITIEWSKPSSFSFKEGGQEVLFACQKDAKGKPACKVTNDDLLHSNSYWFGNFAKMDPSSTEYKIARQSAINTLLKWFEQLPDEPVQWRSKVKR